MAAGDEQASNPKRVGHIASGGLVQSAILVVVHSAIECHNNAGPAVHAY